jgi:hypothetical protein
LQFAEIVDSPETQPQKVSNFSHVCLLLGSSLLGVSLAKLLVGFAGCLSILFEF